MKLIYQVKKENLTINQIMKNELHISSRLSCKLIKNKLVFCNSICCDTRNKTNIGDIICIDLDYEEDTSNIIAKKMDLNIVYEDEWLLIINKPRKIAVHPSILHFEDSLANGVKFYFRQHRFTKKNTPR